MFLNQAKYHSTVEIMRNYSLCLSTGKAIPTSNANRRLNNTKAVTDVQEKWEYTENKWFQSVWPGITNWMGWFKISAWNKMNLSGYKDKIP